MPRQVQPEEAIPETPPKSAPAAVTPPPTPSTEVLPPVNGLSFKNRVKKVEGTARPKSICIYGFYKTGKTTLAASISEVPYFKKSGKEVLILEAESGTASIADDYPNVDMFELTSVIGLNRAVDELLTKEHNYGVVIFDTLDRFQEWAVSHFVDGAVDTRAAWAEVKEWTNSLVWRLHRAGIIAIFLFHEAEQKKEKAKESLMGLKLQGSSKDDLGQIFDIIGRLTVRRNEEGEFHRILQLGPQEGQITGNRYEKKLPNEMVDPTMTKIFELIMAPKNTTPEEN